MTVTEHNKLLGIAFAVFAAIFAFTFLLLLVITVAVFLGLEISFANETGNSQQAGIGILGAAGTVIFYLLLGVIFVLPTALASRKMLKQRRNARGWGIVASLLMLVIIPLGTMLGVYGLWFFFSAGGKQLYLSGR